MKIKSFHTKAGLTILEILVVVAVLAILLSVRLPKFSGIQDQGYVSQAQAELKTLQLGVVSYYAHANPHAYPATTTTLAASYLTSATPRIVKAPLYDPFGATTSSEYNFKRSSNSKYYIIYSRGVSRSGSATIDDTGAGVLTNNPICVSNAAVTGCLKAGGSGTDACGGCKGGKHCCNGTCVDFSSTSNCGGCGTICAGGQSCCHGVCTNTNGTDKSNCGGCAVACSSASNVACCSGSCVDLNTNNSNCGSCGHGYYACCVSGSGWNPDFQNDPNNCGGCNVTCSGYTTECCAGTCKDPSVDYQSDTSNCGSCGSVCGMYAPNCSGGSCY